MTWAEAYQIFVEDGNDIHHRETSTYYRRVQISEDDLAIVEYDCWFGSGTIERGDEIGIVDIDENTHAGTEGWEIVE